MRSAQRAGNVCQSAACVRSAASLLRSMDARTPPCEDFYRHACGRWAEDHPSPSPAFSHDWFYDRRERVLANAQEFLERNNSASSDPWAVKQARILYRACLDTDAWDLLGLEPMLAALEAAGLPRGPPLGNPRGSLTDAPWRWERTAALARKRMNKDLIVHVDVAADIKNRTVNKILVRKFRSGSPLLWNHERRALERRQRILARSRASRAAEAEEGAADDVVDGDTPRGGSNRTAAEQRQAAALLAYMTNAMHYMLKANESSDAGNARNASAASASAALGSCLQPTAALPLHISKAAQRAMDFNDALWELRVPSNKSTERDKEPEDMWVWELQNLTDLDLGPGKGGINWTELLTLMFDKVPNVTLDLSKQKIMVEDNEYLAGVSQLLARTPPETLQLALWWELVEMMAPYTTSQLRLLRRRYTEMAWGPSPTKGREAVCTEAVNGLMGMAVSYYLADASFLRTTAEKVHEMFADIRHVFEDLVSELDWMDSPTKAATLGKARAMRPFVGFPEWLLRSKDLDDYYDGVNMTTDAFLSDMLSFQERLTTLALSALDKTNEDFSWATDPTDVNAFHTFQYNSVTIPAGILQFPFYDLGLEALNYGAIGSILGHEFTHGFDSYGRLFDRDGNMRPWWSNATVEEYQNRTACFVKQYGDYFLPEVEMSVDGELTLEENIADNGGLYESMRAYRRFEARRGEPEPLLPGMHNYTHEQLFFLAYVHVWCESWTEDSLRWSLEDEHAPSRVRAWGVLTNSEDFARAWGCPLGSAMNPDRPRCRLW